MLLRSNFITECCSWLQFYWQSDTFEGIPFILLAMVQVIGNSAKQSHLLQRLPMSDDGLILSYRDGNSCFFILLRMKMSLMLLFISEALCIIANWLTGQIRSCRGLRLSFRRRFCCHGNGQGFCSLGPLFFYYLAVCLLEFLSNSACYDCSRLCY